MKLHRVDVYDENEGECRERALVAAVLQRAIEDAVGKDPYERHDVKRFFECTDYKPFSFFWCCHLLGINPEDILDKIKEFQNYYQVIYQTKKKKEAVITNQPPKEIIE